MLHLVTQTTLHFLDVDREFRNLCFEQVLPSLAELLNLSNITLEEDAFSINPKRTLNAIPIHTRFGYTTMDNIPTGVKCFTFLKLKLYDESKYIIPEFLIGRFVLRHILSLAESANYTLFAPNGEFSAISLRSLEDAVEYVVTVDGKEVMLLC